MCLISASALESHLHAGSTVAIAFHRGCMVATACLLPTLMLEWWARWLDEFDGGIDWTRQAGCLLVLGAFLGAFSAREQTWATPVAALSMAGLLWLRFSREERRLAIALAGCLWGAIYPLTLDWPNADRMNLGLFIGGLATAVQGAVQIGARFFSSTLTQQ